MKIKLKKRQKKAERRRKRSPAGPGGPSELETLEFWDEEIPGGSAHLGPGKIRQQRPGGREFQPSGSFPLFPARAGTGQRRRKGKKSLYWKKKGLFWPIKSLFWHPASERASLSGSRREFPDFGELGGFFGSARSSRGLGMGRERPPSLGGTLVASSFWGETRWNWVFLEEICRWNIGNPLGKKRKRGRENKEGILGEENHGFGEKST